MQTGINWTSNFCGYIKNCLRTMTAANAEIVAKCIKGAFQQKILIGMHNAWESHPNSLLLLNLEKDEYGMGYQTRHMPCDFWQEDGSCKLGDCKPDSCKKYPYTNQPERLSSLLSILDTIEICPVAFEIFERLKKEYGFKVRR